MNNAANLPRHTTTAAMLKALQDYGYPVTMAHGRGRINTLYSILRHRVGIRDN